MSERNEADDRHEDLLKTRGGRIDTIRRPPDSFDDDSRIDQAIAESFPASDPPSWNSGVEKPNG